VLSTSGLHPYSSHTYVYPFAFTSHKYLHPIATSPYLDIYPILTTTYRHPDFYPNAIARDGHIAGRGAWGYSPLAAIGQ